MTQDPYILLVEDDHDIRELLVDTLNDEGYPTVGAIDGLDALELLHRREARPRLILLDLMMPRMSGAQFRNELSTHPRLRDVPVVILTADANGRSKAEALGAKDCLQKPVKLERLFDTVRRFWAEPGASA